MKKTNYLTGKGNCQTFSMPMKVEQRIDAGRYGLADRSARRSDELGDHCYLMVLHDHQPNPQTHTSA